MMLFKELEVKLKSLIEVYLEAFTEFDKNKDGIQSAIPDASNVEMFKLGLNLFNIYIAISDGELDEKEAEIINSISGTEFTKIDLWKIAKKAEIDKADFAKQVPMMLRVIVEADNIRSDKKPGGTLFSDGLYQIYALAGVYVMAINEKISDDEYKRLIGYLNVMYDYMKHYLKYSSDAIQKPAELVSSILSKVTYDDTTINIKISLDVTGDANAYDGKTDNSAEDDEDEKTLEELLNELNSLIGLDEVKYDVILKSEP